MTAARPDARSGTAAGPLPDRGLSALRQVPYTGVIYVNAEARRLGYRQGDPEWANLGQGQPEAGQLAGAPPRVERVEIDQADQEYGPVAGLPELREAVANLYNQMYRQGKRSQYTAENVAIAGGGRASLTRLVSSLTALNLGHFLPDYTAYEELLELFRGFNPIPILLKGAQGYAFSVDDLREEVQGRGLGALLLSNPCNPTGKLIHGPELAGWVAMARELDCTLLIDEFYSHYIWSGTGGDTTRCVSAAAYVEDVDHDPVVIVDGLTKNWRYPGWRVTWTVGPRAVIEAASSAGSFLDGGANRPLQRAAVPLLDPEATRDETRAIRESFARKRMLMIEGLESLGITLDRYPDGTFYCWGNLKNLPEPFNDGMHFFRGALQHKVIVVPGEFFDVNPGKRRPGRTSRFRSHVRFSFGPDESTVRRGLEGLGAMLAGG